MLSTVAHDRSARRWTVFVQTFCALGLGSALLAPGVAAAATADGDVDGRRGEYGQLTFTGAPGEANRVRITVDDLGRVLFTDVRNPVVAVGGCERLDAHTARCESGNNSARALLGDGDDWAVIDTEFVIVRGGAGDDQLTGADHAEYLWGDAGDDTLRGGRGDDQLAGGRGRDRLYGGPGADFLSEDEKGAQTSGDLFDGGPNSRDPGVISGDTVNFYGRRDALRIDLGAGTSNTHDRLVGIESLIGGRGDDQLTGDEGQNALNAGPGSNVVHGGEGGDSLAGGDDDDELYGEDGNDAIQGAKGLDVLSGGAGNDILNSEEESGRQQADAVSCDIGQDTVLSGRGDTLTTDCETVGGTRSELTIRTVPSISAERVDFTVRCATGTTTPGCAGTISLRAANGQPFGAAEFHAPGDATETVVSIPLNTAAVTALRTGATVRVDLLLDDVELQGSGSYRITLSAPAA